MDIIELKNRMVDFTKDNEVINFMTDTLTNGYDKYIDFADIIDELGKLSEPVKIVLKVVDYAKQTKFKAFIINVYKEYNSGNTEQGHIEKLQQYLKNKNNLNFVIESIDSAVNSKNILCSSLLGIFVGKILNKTQEIKYRDYIIINALKEMLDYDLINFKKIFEKINGNHEQNFKTTTIQMNELFRENNVDRFEVEQTIEKLKGCLIFGYDRGGLSSIGNAWGAFILNENSNYLYELIKCINM